MTGEAPPSGTSPDPGTPSEPRASHEDRDRVVDILSSAVADGRLTPAELDERAEAALKARTRSELAALTVDLQASPGDAAQITAQAKDVIRLDCQGGNVTRRGQWVVPARMEIRAIGGTVKLDFTKAVITQSTLQINAYVRGGRLVLVTKPGIEVDADNMTLRSGRVKVRPQDGWKEPARLRVEVSGEPCWPRGRPPAPADIPAMATAQTKAVHRIIPRLTPSSRPATPGSARLPPMTADGACRGSRAAAGDNARMASSAADAVRRIGIRLSALAQDGLTYAPSEYDLDRYRQVGQLAAELLAVLSGRPADELAIELGRDSGYATPKIDVRGAVFDEHERVLLMQEKTDGRWSLPGGWADPGEAPSAAAIREIVEETGYACSAVKLIACWDRELQGNPPPLPVHVYKLFFLCRRTGPVQPPQALETLDVGWFGLDGLPPLSLGRVNHRQLQRALTHHRDPSLATEFD